SSSFSGSASGPSNVSAPSLILELPGVLPDSPAKNCASLFDILLGVGVWTDSWSSSAGCPAACLPAVLLESFFVVGGAADSALGCNSCSNIENDVSIELLKVQYTWWPPLN